MQNEKVVFSGHAIQRMFERGISPADVIEIIRTGEVIAEYPAESPEMQCWKLV